jgi:hypothetical protein
VASPARVVGFKSKLYHLEQPVCSSRQDKLVFGTNVIARRIVRKGRGRSSRAKSYAQTAACSGFSDNIRKANTDPRAAKWAWACRWDDPPGLAPKASIPLRAEQARRLTDPRRVLSLQRGEPILRHWCSLNLQTDSKSAARHAILIRIVRFCRST